jgi:hypothetical protein
LLREARPLRHLFLCQPSGTSNTGEISADESAHVHAPNSAEILIAVYPL